MIIISYDIADNKLRTKFSKFIKKYGHRIQYSVFEIDNSKTILKANCEITRMGYAKNEESDIIIA